MVGSFTGNPTQLVEQIPREPFEGHFGELYCPNNGRLGLQIRMIVGLLLLKYVHSLLDEKVVEWWFDNPYAQYFCGETHFQQKLQLDWSSFSWIRIFIDESGCELTLQSMVNCRNRYRCIEEKRLEACNGGYHGVGEGGDVSNGCEVAESSLRVGSRLLLEVNRYAHACQMKRTKREVKKMHTIPGREVRDVESKSGEIANSSVHQLTKMGLVLAERVMGRERTSKNWMYSADAPEVESISRGKAHKRIEFVVKAGGGEQ